MTSIKTQLPYEYYHSPVHCQPNDGVRYKSENLGEILRGDRIVNTKYNIQMGRNSECQILCDNIKLTQEQSKTLAKRIKDAYHVHL
jgi:transmembrane 9 superfamily protein 2/4